MNSNQIMKTNSLLSYKQTKKRRTTSNIIGNENILNLHKTSNSIGSAGPYFDAQLEKIKIEIKERLKEQQKREEFLKNMLQLDNEPSNTEMYTETNRKVK